MREEKAGNAMSMFGTGWLRCAPGLIAIVILVLSIGCTEKPRIEWEKDIDAALSTAREIRKPVMIDFTAAWCPPCHAMEDSTFSAPEVIEKSRAFITVRIDVDEQVEVAVKFDGNARKYGGIGIPNILFLDADGGKLKHIVGYHGPEQLVSVIDTVLTMLQE